MSGTHFLCPGHNLLCLGHFFYAQYILFVSRTQKTFGHKKCLPDTINCVLDGLGGGGPQASRELGDLWGRLPVLSQLSFSDTQGFLAEAPALIEGLGVKGLTDVKLLELANCEVPAAKAGPRVNALKRAAQDLTSELRLAKKRKLPTAEGSAMAHVISDETKNLAKNTLREWIGERPDGKKIPGPRGVMAEMQSRSQSTQGSFLR